MAIISCQESIRNSKVLTGNNIGQLAGLANVPEEEEILAMKELPEIMEIINGKSPLAGLHRLTQRELLKENLEKAAKIAWLGAYL